MLYEPKTVLRRKLITWNVYVGKEEWFQTNSQRLHLKEFNKQEQIWSKLNRKKNHKVKSNENERYKWSQRKKLLSWEKKSIDKVIKKKYVYITSIRNKREDITTDSIDIKRLIKEHYE